VGKKILIVEDEPAISRVLQAYLSKAGYQVEAAFDGEEALRQFTSAQPDLVLLDVMLPGTDGWSILQYIRRRSSCPVIMLTALGETKQKLAGLNLGADDYITKPFNAEEVVARVQAVLRRPARIWEDQETRQYGSLKIDFAAHTGMHERGGRHGHEVKRHLGDDFLIDGQDDRLSDIYVVKDGVLLFVEGEVR